MTIQTPDVADRSNTDNYLSPIGIDSILPSQAPYVRSFVAANTIRPQRMVMFSGDSVTILEAALNVSKIIGVSTNLSTVSAGDELDVIMGGEATLTLGGTTSAGDFLASDISGRGIPAAATDRFGAVALDTAGENSIITVLVSHGTA